MNRRAHTTPTIIANWKMYLRTEGVVTRISALRKFLSTVERKAHIILCPSFPALAEAHRTIGKSLIRLGAQDLFWDDAGPYTGEVSALQLRDCGVHDVIIGHSERRQLLGETDTMVAKKVICATAHGLSPILCVGETAEQRRLGKHNQVVADQLITALRGLPPPGKGKFITVAYEPIWAIGTGKPADPVIAMHMLDHIFQVLLEVYDHPVVERQMRILYGGSTDRHNVTEYVGPGLFSGALVGGASLEVPGFVAMIKNVIQQYHR